MASAIGALSFGYSASAEEVSAHLTVTTVIRATCQLSGNVDRLAVACTAPTPLETVKERYESVSETGSVGRYTVITLRF